MPWLSEQTRHPVVLLGGVDLDVERLVVDPDAPVATAGHGREVADHVLLEVARRGLHRRLLGPVDGGEGRREDPLAALRGGQLLAPRGEPLGLAGDLFGVDGVGLDPGAGVGLVVARPFEGALLVADLDLEPLAGAGLLGDRPERLERARLLRDLERSRVALRGERARRLLADESLELRGQPVDLGDVRLLARAAGLRPQRGPAGRARRAAPLPWPRASFSSASMSERPRSRRSISTSRICACIR